MNPTGNKFISLFLVFSLIMLSTNLYAKERRGAKLIITKLDGQQVEGELITVKPNSLLLLDTEGKDVSVDIVDIKVIKIVRKSKARIAGMWGSLIGFSIGVAAVSLSSNGGSELFTKTSSAIFAGMVYGGFLGSITWLIGAIVGIDKTFQIEEMTDLDIRETLDYFRKKARIRDYK